MDNGRARDSSAADRAARRIEPARFEPHIRTAGTRSLRFNPRLSIIGILLAFGALCVWYMLSVRAVYIETEPQDASLEIRGGMALKLAGRYFIRPGEYALSLSAPGYSPLEETLVVTGAKAQHYIYQLQKQPGRLRIDSGAVTGAEVLLDGIARGKTPVTVRELAPGEYRLEVRSQRYFPFQEKIVVEGLDREQSVLVALKPAWAEVSFDSRPPGAEVFNGDESLGSTPLTTEIMEGRHTIRLKSPGRKVWQDTIDVTAGKPLLLDGIELALADATLFLVSEPARANTTVNGDYLGLTPLELPLTPGETATIRLFRQGYKPATRSVSAQSGEKKRLRIALEPELVSVVISARPEDAKLYVDGALIGDANRTLELSAGKHKIEIRKPGYVDYSTELTPHTGVEHRLNVRLKTVKQVKLENLKAMITTHAGQSLKLLYPGAFTMGASRREPGRKANETLRRVNLTRPFYLGLKEVTNREYRLFDKGFASGAVKGNSLNGETQPVVNVTWEQAARYCNWLSKQDSLSPFYVEKDGDIAAFDKTADGYRLPTEAEWAWAARVTGGGDLLRFPWGEQLPPKSKSGNFADRKAGALFDRILEKYDDGFIVSAPVGSFVPNHRGLFDLAGNVAEWTGDFYDVVVSGDKKVQLDPVGPSSGEFHVIRGSSWQHSSITELRLSFRDYGNEARRDLGFRIARYAD